MLRRITYPLALLIFLIVMSLPIFAFVLAARGELMVGNEQSSYVRIFMVSSDEADGIGIQRVKKMTVAGDCLQGSVRYLLWEGQSRELAADYCTCFVSQLGQVSSSGQCEDQR